MGSKAKNSRKKSAFRYDAYRPCPGGCHAREGCLHGEESLPRGVVSGRGEGGVCLEGCVLGGEHLPREQNHRQVKK